MNTCTPEEVGVSSQRLAVIQPALQAVIDARLAPGFVLAVARRGKVFYQDCLGWKDVESSCPIAADTIFRIYSMTKPIATAALMMLWEEGRFSLAEPAAKYIPGFKKLQVYTGSPDGQGYSLEPLQRDITILDLALHTAGLSYGLFMDTPVDDLYHSAGFVDYNKLVFTLPLAEVVERILDLPLANQPGQRWRYGMGIDILGRLVELISDCPFDVFLKERIFDPLGMVDTGFYCPPEKNDRMSTMYYLSPDGMIKPLDHPSDSPFTNSKIAPSGGAGLLSTAADYLQFSQAMLNGGELEGARILAPRTVAKMARNHLPPTLLPMIDGATGQPMWGMGFGPGFGVVMDAALMSTTNSDGTFFWGGAAATAMCIDPREQLTGVLMTQVLGNTTLFSDYFTQGVYQAIME